MAWFPFFIDLEQKEGLIVGGGGVALGKARRLLPYGPRITVTAPRLLPDFYDLDGLVLWEKPFAPEMLEGKFFVIAATGDVPLNRSIAGLCRERNILVNVVDDKRVCDFLFPSLVKRGSLSIGVSTGGASPGMAAYLRKRIEEILPARIEDILAFLQAQRPRIKNEITDESQRSAVFQALMNACLKAGGPISQDEVDALLSCVSVGEEAE